MHSYLLWLCVTAYALHILEEAVLDWKCWAATNFLPNVNWATFDIANIAVLFTAISTAMVNWNLPAYALMLPALMLINAIFFHILPAIRAQKITPGVITATLLFLPIGISCYWGAYQDGVLDWFNLIVSIVLGMLLMASPIVFLQLRASMDKKASKRT